MVSLALSGRQQEYTEYSWMCFNYLAMCMYLESIAARTLPFSGFLKSFL